MCGNIRDHGFETSGAYDVLRTIMSYEYLWQNIRVKGGAYGCGMSMSLSGNLTFSSYRDPNLFETVEVYRGVPEYVRNLSISDRDMVKYILGTFSNVDMPMQPSQEGETETNRILQGITYEVREKRRNEMLGCTPEKLRALADAIESALRENTVVSVGSETKTPEKGLFATITNLQGESE